MLGQGIPCLIVTCEFPSSPLVNAIQIRRPPRPRASRLGNFLDSTPVRPLAPRPPRRHERRDQQLWRIDVECAARIRPVCSSSRRRRPHAADARVGRSRGERRPAAAAAAASRDGRSSRSRSRRRSECARPRAPGVRRLLHRQGPLLGRGADVRALPAEEHALCVRPRGELAQVAPETRPLGRRALRRRRHRPGLRRRRRGRKIGVEPFAEQPCSGDRDEPDRAHLFPRRDA